MKEYIVQAIEQETIDSFDAHNAPELVRCKDCEYSYCEGFVHERLKCEKHPELDEVKEDWFCADCWQA